MINSDNAVFQIQFKIFLFHGQVMYNLVFYILTPSVNFKNCDTMMRLVYKKEYNFKEKIY